ncbi:unnamed protein product, partial [Rotaria sp. Silwood2]
IVDYGSSRRYLSVKISHDYDRNVFGIESCEVTIDSSQHRTEILSKYQEEIYFNVKYKATSTVVDSKTNFQNYFIEHILVIHHHFLFLVTMHVD